MGINTTLFIIDFGYRKAGVLLKVPDFIVWNRPVVKVKPLVASEYEACHEDRSVVFTGILPGHAALMAMFDVGPNDPDFVIKQGAQDCVNGIALRLEAFTQGEDMRNDVDRIMDKVAEKASQEFDIAPEKVFV